MPALDGFWFDTLQAWANEPSPIIRPPGGGQAVPTSCPDITPRGKAPRILFTAPKGGIAAHRMPVASTPARAFAAPLAPSRATRVALTRVTKTHDTTHNTTRETS